MTLERKKEIIMGWVVSCETSEQLILLDQAVSDFWMHPKEKETKGLSKAQKKEIAQKNLEIQFAKQELKYAIEERKLIVIAEAKPSALLEVPTIGRYNY